MVEGQPGHLVYVRGRKMCGYSPLVTYEERAKICNRSFVASILEYVGPRKSHNQKIIGSQDASHMKKELKFAIGRLFPSRFKEVA